MTGKNEKDREDPQPDHGKGPKDDKGRPVDHDHGRPVKPHGSAAVIFERLTKIK